MNETNKQSKALTQLQVQVELDNGTVYTSQPIADFTQAAPLDLSDTIQGCLRFTHHENGMVVSLQLTTAVEISYIHPRFHAISLVAQVEADGNFLAHYNYNGWWTCPDFAQNMAQIKANTQILGWQKADSTFVLTALCDDQFKSKLSGSQEGLRITLDANTCGYSAVDTQVCVLQWGEDPYQVYQDAMGASLQTLNTTKRNGAQRRYPELFEYLGFCTWNAFYHDVNQVGVLAKADEFTKKELPVKWMLLDHGWSEQDGVHLKEFTEDFEKFPQGLQGLKTQLAQRGVDHLGVWQGFCGHWGTISKHGQLYQQMQDNFLHTHTGDVIPYPSKEKTFTFWNAWHRYLKQQGVDFVKVDIQSSLATFTQGHMAIGEAAREAHLGLEASVGVNFDGALINCMGMGTEQLFNRPVSGIARNSNDFFPKKELSFIKHAYENAYNTLYHSALIHGDWDMWWTKHPDATSNAYLRALSGGPLYISDCVGETQAEQLWPLILQDGRVLRCQSQGVVVKSQIFQNPADSAQALKIWNRHGNTAYVGAFPCYPVAEQADYTIGPADINASGGDYLVVDYTTDSCGYLPEGETLQGTLAGSASALYSLTPVVNGFAFLGNREKYISSGVIERTVDTDPTHKLFVLKEGGKVTFYATATPTVRVNGLVVKPTCDNHIYTYDCSAMKQTVVIEIELT